MQVCVCVCMFVCSTERARQGGSEIEVQHKEQRSIVQRRASSGPLRARRPHAVGHSAQPEEES